MTAPNPYVEDACQVMHEAYETAAVTAGWETNPTSRTQWAEIPEANRETMRAAVRALFVHLAGMHPHRAVAALMSVAAPDDAVVPNDPALLPEQYDPTPAGRYLPSRYGRAGDFPRARP